MHLRLSLAALLCLFALRVDASTEETDIEPAGPRLQIDLGRSSIAVSGEVSSLAHEAILRQLLLQRFADHEQDIQLSVRGVSPPGWALVTELTLKLLAESWSGQANIDTQRLYLRGITLDRKAAEFAAARLQRNLLPGMTLDYEFAEIYPPRSFERQCLELLRTASRGRPVEFGRSSAELSGSAYAVLDELVQIAADCPAARIAISGHTDNTGNEENNIALSEARARAVADYLIAGGIRADRIRSSGLGSAQPIVTEDSNRARQLNRRIEFDFSFAE
jgi:OOP family OmpA-OmpF porin